MLISAVIPCHNVDGYVADCLRSVLSQTYSNIEIICVDDGSTDGTLQVLREFEAECAGRMRVFTGPNQGAAAARNRGLEVARGKYVQFLDADDLLLSGKIEHQVCLIHNESKSPDLIAASYTKLGRDGHERVRPVCQDAWTGLISTRLGITSSNLWRRCFLQGIGGWDESRKSSQEAELMFRMLRRHAHVVFDPECLTVVRERPGSITHTDLRGNRERWLQLRKDVLDHMKSEHLLTPERLDIASLHIFRVLRQLFGEDPSRAVKMHNVLKSTGVRPPSKELGRFYLYSHRIVGFKWTQGIHPYWLQARSMLTPYRVPSSEKKG